LQLQDVEKVSTKDEGDDMKTGPISPHFLVAPYEIKDKGFSKRNPKSQAAKIFM